MLVFIDESGDPGFKIAKGSSPIFVAAMVIFQSSEAALDAQRKIGELQQQVRVHPEWKFQKCDEERRDAFFNGIAGLSFETRAVAVRKELIYSTHLMNDKNSFYSFFVRMMMKNDGGMLREAKVVIDGSGDRSFKKQFKAYIRKYIPSDCVKDVSLKDSKSDPLVQLADMVAGAIARSYRTDRTEPGRWRAMLDRSGQLQNVWNFR